MQYKYPYKKRLRTSPITKELKIKHKLGLTLSPIDLCLRKGIINQEMHRAANHLIFLHNGRFNLSSLRHQISKCYKIPGIGTSYFPSQQQLEKTRKEYIEVSTLLKKLHAYDLIVDTCIHNIYPFFLRYVDSFKDDSYLELEKFKYALNDMNHLMMNMFRKNIL